MNTAQAQAGPEHTYQPETEPSLQPAIWAASLLDQEYGIAHGAWIAANQPAAALRSEIGQMLAASPVAGGTHARAERWAITRCRGFAGYPLKSTEDLGRISELAAGLVQHGPPFAAWARLAPGELNRFDEAFLGHFEDMHEFMNRRVQQLAWDETVTEALPESIRPYVLIDVAKASRDFLASGQIRTAPAITGGIWIFRG